MWRAVTYAASTVRRCVSSIFMQANVRNGRKRAVSIPGFSAAHTSSSGQDRIGRNYLDIPIGRSQLLSVKASQLLAERVGLRPAPWHPASHLFQKLTNEASASSKGQVKKALG